MRRRAGRQVLRTITFEHHRDHPGILVDADAKGLGDRVGGDVVMSGANSSGGEYIIIARAQSVEGGDDLDPRRRA